MTVNCITFQKNKDKIEIYDHNVGTVNFEDCTTAKIAMMNFLKLIKPKNIYGITVYQHSINSAKTYELFYKEQ